MSLILDGTNGISGVDGTAANPAIKGADSNTGISYGTDTVTINTGGVARVTTDASGNVGIGTASPESKIDVNGVVTSSSSGKYLNLGWAGSNAYIQTTDVSSAAYNLIFYGGAAERMRIDSSGNLLVGTTSAALSGYTGVVASGGAGVGVALNASRNDVAANASAGVITAYTNFSTTQEKFIVRANGDVQNRTGSYTAYSDERLKENITDARSYTEDLCKLRVVNYQFKADTIKTKYLGFVAQEVEQVIPGLVFETETDGLNDCKGVKLTILIPMLVKAIQELKAEFDAYKAAHP